MEDKRLVSFLVIILPLIYHTSAVLLNQDGVIRPRRPYVHYGEDLILWCNLTRPEIRENSSSMYFMFNDQIIPRKYIRIVNTKSIKLVYKVTPERFECSAEVKRFNFICLLNKTSGPEVLDNELVQVNYAVKPISNFQCHVSNWESMNCSWDLSTKYCNYGDINVTLVYVVGDSRQQDCHSGTRTSCVWNENIFHPDMPYRMIVEVRNNITDVKKATEVMTIQTKNIVKPAPVSDFRVSRDRTNSTCLVAVWNHMKKHRKRLYKLEIMAEYDEIPKVMYFYERDNYTFCGLQPYTLYTISVSNIPVQDGRQDVGFWSDTVETVIRTAEDVPGGPPGLTPGSFAERLCESFSCGLQLYWKPVDHKVQHGHIDQYKIQATSKKSKKTFTFLASGNMTSFPIDLPERKREEYNVSISARTSKGFSNHDALLIIPSIEKAPSKVENVVVEAVRNTGTNQYLIQWSDDEQEKVYTYTLYYCKRSDKTQDCRESLSWETLDASRREFMLELEMEDDDFTWHQIGISREEEGEGKIKSSGIVWNKCVYIKDTKPSSEPDNVRFADLQPDRALLVEWDKLDCIENKAYVTSYLIHICLIMNRNGPCVGEEENITVSNKLSKFQIENLTPSSLYQVTIQAVSRAGIGPKSLPISHHVTDGSLNTGEIAGIVVGCMFVLALLVFAVLRCIRFAKKEKKTCNNLTQISSPKFPETDFLHTKSDIQSRPLPKPPLNLSQIGGTDSGFEGEEEGQYEPVGSPQNSRKSVTSKTILLNHMESMDTCDHLNQLSPSDTSPYAVSDVTRGPCVHPVNIATSHNDQSVLSECANSSQPMDSYTKFGCDSGDSQQSNHNGVNNFTQTVGFVTRPNLPSVVFPAHETKSEQCEKIFNKPQRPQTVACPPAKPSRMVPMIPPTENSDSSEDCASDYIPVSDVLNTPTRRENKPRVVCELVSPSGDIHNTQTLLIRRTDPMRPLSDYMHNLPKQFFVDPDMDQPGPTTEL